MENINWDPEYPMQAYMFKVRKKFGRCGDKLCNIRGDWDNTSIIGRYRKRDSSTTTFYGVDSRLHFISLLCVVLAGRLWANVDA